MNINDLFTLSVTPDKMEVSPTKGNICSDHTVEHVYFINIYRVRKAIDARNTALKLTFAFRILQ